MALCRLAAIASAADRGSENRHAFCHPFHCTVIGPTYKEHNVPRFYFSANFSWKPGLKDLLTKDRRHAEKAYRDAGQIPWWADEVNAAWLVDAAEKSREPPNGHGCEQGFRRGLPADKPPMGLFFWPVDPVPGPAF